MNLSAIKFADEESLSNDNKTPAVIYSTRNSNSSFYLKYLSSYT